MNFTAKDLISDIIIGIEIKESGEKALSMMNVFQVRHLPIVDNNTLIGILNEDDILVNGFDKKIKDYNLDNKSISVIENCHIFNIIDKLAKNDLSLIPVVDNNNLYIGSITQQGIFQNFGDIFTFEFPGSIIEIKIPIKDYSLSKISQIIESENASIIGLMINVKNPSDNVMEIIIKLDKKNISRIIASFERFGYNITASYSSENYSSDMLKERYDALMHYLNV